MKMKELFTETVRKRIESEKGKVVKPIIVLMGDARLLDIDTFRNNITDLSTYSLDGDETIFDNDWYVRTITALKEDRDFHLLSYPQFHYLHSYYSRPELFVDRVIILRDNLRQLFPLPGNDCLEKTAEENIEARPENLPTYQVEQISLEGLTHYAEKKP